MITPLLDRETIDREGQRQLIDRLIGGGVHGLFLLGTTGEGPSLSRRMKSELIRFSAEQVAGRVPLFVSIADCCIEESLSLAEEARACGADCLVAALPYYLGLTEREIVAYYTRLADRVPLPLFLYNIPAQTKLNVSADAVAALAAHPNIRGMKDSSGSGTYFNTLLARIKGVHPDFSLLVGPDEMLAPTMLLGGNGGVNSGSNLFPELYVALFEACRARDFDRIGRLQRLVMRVSTDIYSVDRSPVAFLKGLKAALHVEGVVTDCICEPLQRIGEEEMETIRRNVACLKQQIREAL